jgi:hypothetical protein
MMRITFAFLVSVSLLTASVFARPVIGKSPTTSSPLALAGTTWHTVHIDGDALFFLIDELGVRFEKDGRFAARLRFVDRQQTVKTGTYRVEGGTMIVTIGGGKPKEIEYWTDQGNLIVRDKAYDVTARLAPGKMEDEGWFW